MSIRLFSVALACTLLYFMLSVQAATFSLNSKVDDMHYTLDGMELSLENINSSMRVVPSVNGQLVVEGVHASRLVVTRTDTTSAQQASTGLPARISLPVALQVKEARIDEVVIISGNQRQLLTNVAFNLAANDHTLELQLTHATTPWGELDGQLTLDNARPYPLAGKLRASQDSGRYPYEVDLALSGNLEQLQFNTAGLLVAQGQQTRLISATATTFTTAPVLGSININGQLDLNADSALDIRAQLTELNLHPAVGEQSTLNLDLLLHGKLAPQPDLKMTVQAPDSSWNKLPFTLDGSGRLRDGRVQEVALKISLGDNQLTASGAIGDLAQALNWQANLSDLSALGQAFAGSIQARGTLAGSLDKLSWQADLQADKLRLPGSIQIAKLDARATLPASRQLSANIHAEAIQLSQQPPFDSTLTARGTVRDTTLEVQAHGATNTFHGLLDAQRTETGQWLVQIGKLALQGPQPITMEQSTSLRYDNADGLVLDNLILHFTSGRFHLDHLQYGAGRLASQGRVANLGLREIPEMLLSLPDHITGNPVFAGNWKITAADTIDGFAKLALVHGDIGIINHDGSTQLLGLQTLLADLQFQQNRFTFQAEASGSQLGALKLELSSQLSRTDAGLALLSTAPIQLKANGNLQTLRWMPLPETTSGALLDGQINIAMLGSGTLARPGLSGTLQGSNLAFELPTAGVNLTQGTLDASFSDDQLLINQARLHGGDGTLTAHGILRLDRGQPDLALDWQAENFTAISRTDRLIVVAGNLQSTMRHNLLEVAGAVEVVRGLIELARADAPTLGDDVVILGHSKETAPPLRMKIPALKIGIGNSGDQFVLRGRGLDTTLTGTLTLHGEPNQTLHADGSIQAGGTYMAYGQALNIERGQLNFSGPLDNPGLDILALRPNLAVRAGVEIRGSVQTPAVKLVSTPDVPDSDKLSWLVLGHSLDEAGQDQFAMLSLAAGALLSQGQSVPLQTRFARAAGLDSFNISGSGVESASVSLGKQLASNLYLSYEKEVTGLLNVARLTYEITSRWSIRTQAGSESAVDVLYTFNFR